VKFLQSVKVLDLAVSSKILQCNSLLMVKIFFISALKNLESFDRIGQLFFLYLPLFIT
jgi:hypothetical protein